MKKWTVLLADDHVLVRTGLRHLINTFVKFEVIGEASDGLEVIRQSKTLHPDIVLLDLAMPKMRGLEAIHEIKRQSPTSKVLVLSMYDREEYVRQSIRSGADGYLLKESAAEELQSALLHVLEERMYLSPAISKSIVSEWLLVTDREAAIDKSELTERERSILKLLAEGYGNKEVADLLHISVKTVETHRAHIMSKSESHNLAALVIYAIKKGLVDL